MERVKRVKPSISVIIPALNEENSLESTVREALAAMDERFSRYEILIFDDCSSDDTGFIADKLAASGRNIKVIHNKKTRGFGYNYKKGVELAKEDHIVMFPGDNQFSQNSMEELFDLIGKADIVVPYTANYWIRPPLRRVISRGFVILMNLLFGLRLNYYNGTVIHKKEIVKAIPIFTNGFAYQAEILTRLIRSGHSYIEVGISIREREHGSSKIFALTNIMSVLKTILKLIFKIHIKERRKYNKPIRSFEVG